MDLRIGRGSDSYSLQKHKYFLVIIYNKKKNQHIILLFYQLLRNIYLYVPLDVLKNIYMYVPLDVLKKYIHVCATRCLKKESFCVVKVILRDSYNTGNKS